MINNLIIGVDYNYILLFIIGFLPLLYKFLFWIYTIQLKEYRWDRFKEYIFTPQGKRAFFNVFWIIEMTLFIFYCFIWYLFLSDNIYYTAFWGIAYSIFFYYLIFLNIFVIGKILRKRILKPKFTSRILILSGLFSILFSIGLYAFYTFNLWNFTYIYILIIFLLMPVIIFLCNFISLGLISYFKNKKINSAIEKSEKINSVIKVGITGSYGKSSVKEYLSQILQEENNILKTPENINTELGISAIVLTKLKDNFKYFVSEMGAYKVGEIETLGKIVNHKYGFLTAIGNQHLGLFGGIENTKKAKFEIAKKVLKNNGTLYLNGDNKHIKQYLKDNINGVLNGLKFVEYGINEKSLSAKSEIIGIKNGLIKFKFKYKGISEIFETNLLGEHNIINLTGILAFCFDQNMKAEKLKKYLLNLNLPKNTLEIINEGKKILINDTYNLSEEGLFAGLDVLNSFECISKSTLGKEKKDKYQKVLILDDILELGKESKSIHFDIGKKIAKEDKINKILFCGVNYKNSFIEGLIKGGFDEKNIIQSINNFNSLSEMIILFEGRNAKKYFDKLRK